ncbi:MAG: 6-carboxytetrahydropterin synthase QueD [Candidatus Margulisiibacteriota bacterium]
MYEITIEDTFASAHQLVGYEGPCENIHGHTWKVEVSLKGDNLDKLGMLFDFKKAKNVLKDILSGFDHKNLNELKYFVKENPTAENIARTIYDLYSDKMKIVGAPCLPAGRIHEPPSQSPYLSKVTVWESETTCATYSL